MAHKEKERRGSGILSGLITLLVELAPLAYEKWTDTQENPRIRHLQEVEEKLSETVEANATRIRWLYILLVFLALWNAVLTTLFFVRL